MTFIKLYGCFVTSLSNKTLYKHRFLGLRLGAIRGVRGQPHPKLSETYQYYTRFPQLGEKGHNGAKIFWGRGQLGEIRVPLTKVRQNHINIILDLFSSKKATQWWTNFGGWGAIRRVRGTLTKVRPKHINIILVFLSSEKRDTMAPKFFGSGGN